VPTDDLYDEFVQKQKKSCIVGKWVCELSETDQAKFNAALQRSDIPLIAILDWSKARAAEFKRDSLRVHRIGECCCDD
jgi:hypothetical protein